MYIVYKYTATDKLIRHAYSSLAMAKAAIKLYDGACLNLSARKFVV